MAPVKAFLVALFFSLLFHSSHGKAVHGAANKKAITSPELETTAGDRLSKAECKSDVDQDDLNLGLALGSQFLVKSQREAGNFRYEFNWKTQEETDEDNPVRQAGTLWGLTLLHVDEPKRDLLPAIRKGLAYFQKHSVEHAGGIRLVKYPGDLLGRNAQKLGTVGLLALSHIEVLRRPEVLESEEKIQLEAHLKGYLKALLAQRTQKNNFYKFYDGNTGKPFGPSSPYYDGECLLALVKAAKYLGHDDLWPHIKVSAEAGWRKNVMKGLKLLKLKNDGLTAAGLLERDKQTGEASARMKGYYQWGSMAWYELLDTKDPEFSKYGPRMLRYGSWLLQKGISKSKDSNYGFAFEGIIPAYITSIREGNAKLEQKFACVIREGVSQLHTLQVGHPKAYDLASPAFRKEDPKANDERAQGGAQGTRDIPALRIDTTQHQLHALLMASRLIKQQPLI